MTKRTAKILAILFAFFSFSAVRESITILTSKDDKTFSPIALILTAGFIWTSVYFWKKSKKTGI
jgi:hypothetical protein